MFCEYSSAEDEKETKEELVQSETKDGKLEIVKQIKKINDDGSYTIGYEADDGTFKIESRDVLGNVKGTYGFIDEAGEIKRVSYSSSNSTEIKTEPTTSTTTASSVVQRIPRLNRTLTTTSRRFSPVYPTSSTRTTPTSAATTVVQSIPRRRTTQSTTSSTTTVTTTTDKPSYTEIVRAAAEVTKATTKPPSIVYASPVPFRAQIPLVDTTASTHINGQKSEGQILRPEVSSTDIPLLGRFILRNPVLESESSITKPVTEEPEVHGNILRRQLQRDKSFDVQQHVVNLRQSHGSDAPDVYGSSVTTGTPRPLFTTTARSAIIPSTLRYPINYQRNVVAEVTTATPELAQEVTTTEASDTKYTTQTQDTPTVVQIPANRQHEPLVAIRHPQRGTILVPVSQLQGRDVQFERAPPVYNQPQYVLANEQYLREADEPQTQAPIYIRRLPPPHMRSMPVQVDENGYIRELPSRPSNPIQYPVPVPVPVQVSPVPPPRYPQEDVDNAIEQIKPPVSVRDFQKLLELLIIRQSRLEQANALLRQNQEYYRPNYRAVYQPTPPPYVIARNQQQQTGPVQFVQSESQQNLRQRQYISIPDGQASQYRQQVAIGPRPVQQADNNQQQYIAYVQQQPAGRRVARLNRPTREQETDDDFLPPEVREMLLLKMLQLAINPALPVDVSDIEGLESAATTEMKKQPIRNVEILGEETEEEKRARRVKRYNFYRNFRG